MDGNNDPETSQQEQPDNKEQSPQTEDATFAPVAGSPVLKLDPVLNLPIRPIFPPILLQIFPSISSISPTGAIVGTSDLTLNVFGSNFGTNSTVLWNQVPLTTTVISGTQLSAVIPASDMAVAISATVTVSVVVTAGQAPRVSNGVSFNVIVDISAIISQLQAISAIPAALLTELQTYVTIQQGQVDQLTAQVSTDQTTTAGLNSQIAGLQTSVTQQQAQIATLTAQVNAAQAQTASPLDVAQSFKSVLDTIQQNAQAAGGVQTTVSNMNIAIKSLVNIQAATTTTAPQAMLIFPSPTALPDPAHLSTLNLSFSSVPHLNAPQPPVSAQPSPTPSPSPTPTPAPAPPSPSPSAENADA
jgi:uncharacterized coiled-coil protein SlyX